MTRRIAIIFVLIFIGQIQRECYSQVTTTNSRVGIEEFIKLKKHEKRQQKILIDFEKAYKTMAIF
jgi:hypothetical protein